MITKMTSTMMAPVYTTICMTARNCCCRRRYNAAMQKKLATSNNALSSGLRCKIMPSAVPMATEPIT